MALSETLTNSSTKEAVDPTKAPIPDLKRWSMVQANERTYGEEARMRYGDKAVDDANKRLMSLTDEEWNSREKLEGAIIDQLKIVMEAGSESPESADLAAMHKRFIELSWGEGAYSTQAHLGLADGYLADKRFIHYYDSRAGEGATKVLVAALKANLQ